MEREGAGVGGGSVSEIEGYVTAGGGAGRKRTRMDRSTSLYKEENGTMYSSRCWLLFFHCFTVNATCDAYTIASFEGSRRWKRQMKSEPFWCLEQHMKRSLISNALLTTRVPSPYGKKR